MLTDLQLQNFRIFENLKLDLIPQVNVLVGANGAGKTSVLEAIHLLSSGRSFRTRHPEQLLRHNSDFVAAQTTTTPPSVSPIRYTKMKGEMPDFYIGNTKARTTSALGYNLPTQLFDRESMNLLRAEPTSRRRFLDRGVFYFEPTYVQTRKRYHDALIQRNSVLKTAVSNKGGQLAPWDSILAEAGEAMTSLRMAWVKDFNQTLAKVIQRMHLSTKLKAYCAEMQVNLLAGYDIEKPLLTQLQERTDKDILRKNTSIGAHRADFSVHLPDNIAISQLSSGESKTLACILLLAQMMNLSQLADIAPVCLIDDLAAELDESTLNTVVTYLGNECDVQIFFTSLAEDSKKKMWPSDTQTKEFYLDNITQS